MIKAIVAFKKAIAEINLGKFLQFLFSYDVLATYDDQYKAVTKFKSDGSDVDDDALLEFTTRKVDAVNVAEEIVQVHSQKAITDFLQASDVLSVPGSKNLSTTSQMSDGHSVEFGQFAENNTDLSDTAFKSLAISDQELILITDPITSILNRTISDSGEVSDESSISYGSSVEDSQGATDDYLVASDKVSQENVYLTEERELATTKIIQGLASDTDIISIQDQVQSSLATQTSDDAAANDSPLIVAEKVISDTMESQDSGSMRAQNYAEPGYFAENYVGFSQTF